MTADDKAPPKGALEEAVSLFDELRALVTEEQLRLPGPDTFTNSEVVQVEKLDRRRAALEPRLAKRPGYKAKPIPDAEAVAARIWDATIGRKAGTTTAQIKEAARRRDNQAKPRGGKEPA